MKGPENGPAVVQEEDRVDARRAWLTVAAVTVATLGLIGAAWGLLGVYAGRAMAGADAAPTGVRDEADLPPTFQHGVRAAPGTPGAPPPEDVDWGWIDREGGVVTIPLEAAMDLVVRLHGERAERDGTGPGPDTAGPDPAWEGRTP